MRSNIAGFLGVLTISLACGIGMAAPASPASDASLSVIPDNNTLEARQFKIENARLPGQLSVRQSVTAWQVTQGTWNGQVLDGLCIVLVRSTSEDGRSSGSTNCYISHEATLAQRQALLGALVATQPQIMSGHNIT